VKRTLIIIGMLFLALVTILLITIKVEKGSAKGNEESVWFWFENCGQKEMAIEINLDQVPVYSATFSICKHTRDSSKSNSQQKIREFTFVPKREIKWEGHLDENNSTKVGQVIEGNVWQAGADPDALIFGLSFSSQKQIYMNTLHVAHTDIVERTEIEHGLVITTKPIEKKK